MLLRNSFEPLLTNGKGFLMFAGYVEYKLNMTNSAKQRTPFCFERHQSYSAPAQKELLTLCSDDLAFLF